MNNGVGIDLGGSHVSAILLNAQGELLHKEFLPITDHSQQAVIDAIIQTVRKLPKSYSSVGMSVPGNVDPRKRSARWMPSFQWGREVALGEILAKELGYEVEMRNDGRCAAIAESIFGVGRGSPVFALLTLGTGIGGALIVDGTLFDGSTFDAGDFGHHVIRAGNDGFDCVCGKRGCFEMHASAAGLVRHYARCGRKAGNAAEVMDAYRAGDHAACEAFKSYKDDLAHGIANLITFYNPDTIALGGGLSQAPEVFDGLAQLVDDKTLPMTRGSAKIVPAALGPDAGAIGAAWLGMTAKKPAQRP